MTAEQLNRHQLRKQRTRKKIQDALLSLVFEKGVETITIQEITDRADLGRGTFYFHFDDKEDCLWSIVADRIHATEKNVLESYGETLPSPLEYYAYLNMLHHVEQNCEVYQLLVSSKGSQEIANRAKAYLVQETLQDMENFGVFQDIGQPPDITAQIVIGTLFSVIFWWLETPNKYSAEDLAGILYKTLHHKDPPNNS